MAISHKKVIQKWESVRSRKMGKCTDLSGFDKSQIVMARPLGHKCTWGVKAATNRRATIAWITKIYNAGSDRKASGYSLFHMGLHSRRPVHLSTAKSTTQSLRC